MLLRAEGNGRVTSLFSPLRLRQLRRWIGGAAGFFHFEGWSFGEEGDGEKKLIIMVLKGRGGRTGGVNVRGEKGGEKAGGDGGGREREKWRVKERREEDG